MLLLGILAYHAFPNYSWISMPLFWCLMLIDWFASYKFSGASFTDWYDLVFLASIRPLARSMTKLSKEKEDEFPLWEDVFEFWWGFSIKYFVPWAIWWLLMLSLGNDISGSSANGNGYGDYHIFWQIMGFLYPIGGLICFFIPMFMKI